MDLQLHPFQEWMQKAIARGVVVVAYDQAAMYGWKRLPEAQQES